MHADRECGPHHIGIHLGFGYQCQLLHLLWLNCVLLVRCDLPLLSSAQLRPGQQCPSPTLPICDLTPLAVIRGKLKPRRIMEGENAAFC